jgi:hypothetical protein
LVDVVVRHRALGALFSSDPGIARAIEKSLHSSDNFKDRLVSLLVGPDPDIDGAIAARVLFAGIAMAGGSPEFADVEDERLRTALIDAGRRLLGRQRRRGH